MRNVSEHVLIVIGLLGTFGCGAKVVLEDDGGSGGSSSSQTSSSAAASNVQSANASTSTGSDETEFQAYCAAVEQEDAGCGGDFDQSACVAQEACALAMMRPDATTTLLDCLALNVCGENPFDNCILAELTALPLTPEGAVFVDVCIAGSCDVNPYCYLPYWMKPEVLPEFESCIHEPDTGACGIKLSCLLQTPAGDCRDWIARAGLF